MDRIFLDTSFVVAYINTRDENHKAAQSLIGQLDQAQEIVTTDFVIGEIGNSLARGDKAKSHAFLESLLEWEKVTVVYGTAELVKRGLELYGSHRDKDWGLIDCFSMIVMRDRNLTTVFTADHHFEQAGFEIVLK